MTDFYPQVPLGTSVIDEEAQRISQPNTGLAPNNMSSASSYANLSYLFGVQDPALVTPKTSRNRRRPAHGSEHVKHRRTRSGCYTCRSRRVKCDEAHPICERCKKGNRECVYPERVVTSKASGSKNSQHVKQETHGSSTDEYDDEDESDRLKTIPDENENLNSTQEAGRSKFEGHRDSTSQSLKHETSFTRGDSETPSLVQDKGPSPTPSTEGSISLYGFSGPTATSPRSQVPDSVPEPAGLRNDWSHLPQDLQFYLAYFCDNLTYNHYSLKHDSGDFLRTHFLDATLRNDALLYAVVGFSAFQYTLINPRGLMQDFLQYYNKAVSLLLRLLKRGERHNLGILLTMLQLATIEEYLGDWVNLLGHQKAAYEILTELYNPQKIMETEVSRMILGWYARFDVFAGLMGGFETVLSREWFSYSREWFALRIAEEPNDVNWKIEEAIANTRLIAMDMSILFARKGKKEISHEEFLAENEIITKRISDWKDKMDPALQDPRWRVTDFTGAPPYDPHDIVDPYIPGTLYYGPLWSMSKCWIDWYAIDLMHKYQTALTLQSQPSKELAMTAYATCQLFESVEYWPGSPKGSIVACQASLGIASLFLPRDKQHSMWCRRKLAVVESHGYIYPLTFRTKMSALFQDPSCMHWWLPNDESYPPIIRSIRKFVEERTSTARDIPTEDLRDMKAIFAQLKLDDGKTHIPVSRGKNRIPQGQVTVANDQDWKPDAITNPNLMDIGNMETDFREADTYSAMNYHDNRNYWGSS